MAAAWASRLGRLMLTTPLGSLRVVSSFDFECVPFCSRDMAKPLSPLTSSFRGRPRLFGGESESKLFAFPPRDPIGRPRFFAGCPVVAVTGVGGGTAPGAELTVAFSTFAEVVIPVLDDDFVVSSHTDCAEVGPNGSGFRGILSSMAGMTTLGFAFNMPTICQSSIATTHLAHSRRQIHPD